MRKEDLFSNDNLNNKKTEYIENDSLDDEDKTEYVGFDDGTTSYIDNSPKENLVNGRYKLLEIVGAGGMGVVYKAEDVRLDKSIVAIKQIKIDESSEAKVDELISVFKNEASSLIKLRHQSIPRILEYFVTDDMDFCIVMDYIEGKTLETIVNENGKLEKDKVDKYLEEMVSVLKYLHTREPKVIFRDFKPSNIMIDEEDNLKLIDFGIARNFDDMKKEDTSYYVSHGYSAPEQYGFAQSDERSDIYSLGCVLYFMITGKKPRLNSSNYISDIEQLDTTEGFKKVMISSMDYKAELRPQSIDEFINMAKEDESTPRNRNTTEINLDDTKEFINKNTKLNKGIKIKKSYIGILIALLVGTVSLYGINKSYQSNSSVGNDTVVDNGDTTDNLSKWERKKVDKAIDAIYEKTGESRMDVRYELSTSSSYIESVRDNFYIFNVVSLPEGDWSDCNIAVKKKDNSVYYGDVCGMIIPYEDYQNYTSRLYDFVMDYSGNREVYSNISEELEKLGAEKFFDMINEILYDVNPLIVGSDYATYVDIILSNVTKEEIESSMKNNYPFYGTDDIDSYVEFLEDQYMSYGFDYQTIKDTFEEGWNAGLDYYKSLKSKDGKDMDEYVDRNSPENISGTIWSYGFWGAMLYKTND